MTNAPTKPISKCCYLSGLALDGTEDGDRCPERATEKVYFLPGHSGYGYCDQHVEHALALNMGAVSLPR